MKWTLPKAPNLELTNARTNYGLAYRIVGIVSLFIILNIIIRFLFIIIFDCIYESLAFLASALMEAKFYIQACIPPNVQEFFNIFYNEDVTAAVQFKPYAYKTNVAALLNVRFILVFISFYFIVVLTFSTDKPIYRTRVELQVGFNCCSHQSQPLC